MTTADFIKTADLKELSRVFDYNGIVRNQIIDTLEQDKNFEMQYGMGSRFSFFYKGNEHRINLNMYDNQYELDYNSESEKHYKTLTEVLNALN